MTSGGEDGARSWSELIDSEESRAESVLQAFLERNPSLLPGSRTLDTNSGHHPWPHAVVSQPPLPALSTKRPDFMWIACDSGFLYPILIEIETPWKRWFQDANLVQHSDLTTALSQVAQWRSWFGQGRNQAAFYDYYRVPRELQDRTLKPRFMVVHGRRAEANASPATTMFRGSLPISDDTRLVTFDSLEQDPRAAGYFTVTVSEHGYEVHPNSPPTDDLKLPTDVRHVVARLGGLDDEQAPGYRFKPRAPQVRSRRRPTS